MKLLSGLTKCGLVVIAAFCFSASECDLKHNVIFSPDYATADQITLPGTALSPEDELQLRAALRNSDESFYTIQNWIKGAEDGKPFGTLPFPKCLKSHDLDPGNFDKGNKTGISRTNASRWSRVIGQGCQSRCTANTTRKGWRAAKASQDLVNAVKPILQKYQKK